MMTDVEVRQQVERTDRFISAFREMVAATAVDTASPCADYHHRGLEQIAATVDQVDYAFFRIWRISTRRCGAGCWA
jgi:hypothetical protein